MLRKSLHHKAYVVGLMLLVASMPLSHFGMGLMTFLLLLNWIAEWNWREKWERLRANKSCLVLSSLVVVLCIGFIKSDNLSKAFSDWISKFAIFFIPILVATSAPLKAKERRWILGSFVLATFVGCLSSLVYWKTRSFTDIREISIFIDHIRFSLCIVLSIVFCGCFILKVTPPNRWMKPVAVLMALILLLYMFIAQTLTGILILLVISLMYCIYLLFSRNQMKYQKLLLGFFLGGLMLVIGYLGWITYDYFHAKDVVDTEQVTAFGNPYSFDAKSVVENGYHVGYYVCEPELRAAWMMRSDTAYSPLLEMTLIRYLNSQGKRKDYATTMALSDKDVRNVEAGIANYDYTRSIGLRRALYPTFFSFTLYKKYRFLYDSSLLLRVELWSLSWEVIRDNWLLGVGLGDNKAVLNQQIVSSNSPALESKKQGCHNQFLSFWMCGGILVLAYFIVVLFYPFVKMCPQLTFLYVAFFTLMFLSFFMEDTLEVQTGCMLFAVMNPILLHLKDSDRCAEMEKDKRLE